MAHFDRWDVCAAYNMYATLWGGDGCAYENRVQRRLSKLAYRASSSEERLEGLSENANQLDAANTPIMWRTSVCIVGLPKFSHLGRAPETSVHLIRIVHG